MRQTLLMTVIAGLTVGAAPVLAQYPAEAVTQQDVEVRSGPSPQFLPTSKLPRGSKVTVFRESKTAPGWLEIMPPPGSFSWINGKYVKRIANSSYGYVDADPTHPAPVLPGSTVVNQEPKSEIMKLTAGTIVVIIVDKIQNFNGDIWLPVFTNPSEVRYIPKEAVTTATQVTPTSNGPPNWTLTPTGYTTNQMLADAENAIKGNDYNRARQLLTQVQNTSTDTNEKVYAMNRLAQLPPGTYTPAQPVSTQKGNAPVTVMSPANPAAAVAAKVMTLQAAAWSVYGRLRETTVKLETGQTIYALEDAQGHALTYVATAPGKSLAQYINRMVAVYGPTVYRPDSAVRLNYVVASHVSLP